MNRFEPNLRIPGPTALPPTIRAAGARQMINHRGPEFAAMLERVMNRMKPYFGTSGDVAILSCAGTGGLEAAVVNVLSPGDRVLGVSIGSFGDRFAKIASTYGADVTKLAVEWGEAARSGRGPGGPGRGARAGLPGGPADPQRDVDRCHEPDPGPGRGHPRRGAGRPDPRRQRVRPGRRSVRDGRVGHRRRRDRIAEGVDERPRSGHGRGLGAGLDGDGDGRRCPASISTCALIATPQAKGQTPWTPALAVVYQVDEGLELMERETAGRDLRPPRGLCRCDPGRPPGARLRAVRRPAASRRGR